jgi:O-acetyl-ADP-ribose deacetylase (regulator of RNase III)
MENRMIKYKVGNILSEDVEAIVNTVNCVGIMGRGLALQYKNKYPKNFKEYEIACKKEIVKPGKMFVYQTCQLFNPKYIINFPTKRHWKGKSKIEDIENGLDDLVRVIKKLHIKSIAIPPLGSGLGGLEWNLVKQRIEEKLSIIDCSIIIFEPLEKKIEKNICKNIPKMTAGRAALVGLIDKYLKGLMDPFVTLLEVHKLMYFMQEVGESLRLNYKKASYGPYADNLRHVLNVIEGHLVSGYEDGGDAPDKQIRLVPGAVEDAKIFLVDKKTTKNNFKKVSNLVEGFETPFGLELLSTVHWVIKYENARNVDEVIEKIYSWNDRKKQFSQKQIKIAIRILKEKNWITLSLNQ